MPVAPTLDPLPPRITHPGQTLTFSANVDNPDDVPITYAIDPATAGNFPNCGMVGSRFNWPNVNLPVGARTLTLQIKDNGGNVLHSQSCTVTVMNQPPTLDTLAPQTTHPGRTLMFMVSAADPDGDTLTLTVDPGSSPPFTNPAPTFTPAGQASWLFSWNCPANVTPQGLILVLRVSDPNGGSSTQQCAVSVVNQSPTLGALQPRSVHPGRTLTFTACATDPDGDVLTLSVDAGSSMQFQNTPPTFTSTGPGFWLVSWNCPGNVTPQGLILILRVRDPIGASATQQCVVSVVNQPPIMDPLQPRNVHPGHTLNFTANATDPDNDVLTYSVDAGSSQLFFGTAPPASINAQGQFTWTCPAGTAPQALTLVLRASDPYGATTTQQCFVNVQ